VLHVEDMILCQVCSICCQFISMLLCYVDEDGLGGVGCEHKTELYRRVVICRLHISECKKYNSPLQSNRCTLTYIHVLLDETVTGKAYLKLCI
jgi:hypothetical protein